MEKECLVEETSVDYGESSAFTEENPIQTPKSLCVKTKKVLRKPLGVINYDNVNTDNNILDDSFLLPPSLLIKLSIQVPVCKFFALDINLVAITKKSFQEKLSFIRKIFSSVNGFEGASTLSKFGGVIRATFTSEKAMMAAEKLANDHDVVVNTNLKHPVNNHTNWDIIIKEIPVNTSIKTVRAAVLEFGVVVSIKMQLADLLASKWSILIGKNAIWVARADVNKQTWDSRDEFKALFYTFPVGTNAYDLWNFIGSVGGKTCVIEHNSVNYTWAHCTTVCFESESDLNQALANTPVIKGVSLHWSCLFAALYSSYNSLGHTSRNCKSAGVSSSLKGKRAPLSAQDRFRLVKIYERKSAPVSHPLAFDKKTWASVVGSILSGTFFEYDSQLGSIRNGKPLLPVVNDLEKCLVSIKSSLVSLMKQIGKLAKRLESFVLAVSQSSPGWEDIVMGVGSGNATSDKTAAVLGSTASPEIVKLENMLEGLSVSVMSLSVHLDGLVLAGVVWYRKLPRVMFHKDMNNLVSIFTESKLKKKVHPWLTNKFDGVQVFTFGLDSGSMSAGVLIIMNSSLAKHIYKVSEVPSWLLFIKLFFKNKLSVSILGLYTGALSVVQFSQAGKINSLIAKAINESSFVVLGGDFNENGSRKCASFKKCFELGLVNSLIGSPAIKMLTWVNSRGVMKTIDYMFVSPNLVNFLVYHCVSDVGKYFDTDHQAVSVSMGLGGLLDTCLFSFCKQANKDCWKFDVKNASEAKWLEFKNATAANTTMLSGAFDDAVKFSDLGTMWNVIRKIIVILAGGAFKKRWFKGFDTVHNKVSSRFYKLKLLVSKLVKASCLSFSVSFALLLGTWDNLNFAGTLMVRFMFFSGAKFDNICSALTKVKRLYCSSKLLKSKHAEESHIRQAITNRMESFELDKGHTIKSVLEHPFCKVVLDHLVVDNELVLEPNLVKSKVNAIMEGWTKKCVVVDDFSDTWSCQYKLLNYIFDDVFSEVMSEIDFNELHHVITSFPDGKAVGLSGISNELWKCCNKSVLGLLLDTTTQSPIFVVGSVIENALKKNRELWLVLQDM
ncbi:hypothetical protein G9A89_017138 [Geosiphon pyriformis]|nr:hypothetical protein G9A89_017138 [Geosiphon pyriformis]